MHVYKCNAVAKCNLLKRRISWKTMLKNRLKIKQPPTHSFSNCPDEAALVRQEGNRKEVKHELDLEPR